MKPITVPWYQTEARKLFTKADWMKNAACSYHPDPSIFFPDRGQPTDEAKEFCSSNCYVWKDCLDYALKIPEMFGVWGGLCERERRKIRKGSTAFKCQCGMINIKGQICRFCSKRKYLQLNKPG